MPTADLLSLLEARRPSRLSRRVALAVVGVAAVGAGAVFFVDRPDRPVRPGPERSVLSATAPVSVQTRPLYEWLGAIARDAGLGLVVAPELDGREATAFFAEAPWRQRLETLARVEGLAWAVQSGVIEVRGEPLSAPPDQLSEGAAQAPSRCEQGALAQSAGPTDTAEVVASETLTRIVRLLNARAADLAPVIGATMVKSDVRIAAETAANALLVSGEAHAVEEAERLAAALDVARRRFLLETRIVEISRSARDELGVQWSVSGNLGAVVDLPAADRDGEAAAITVATTGAHALEARIAALEASGRVRIVSRPRVLVVEGTTALIESVRVLRVRLPSRAAVVTGVEGAVEASDGRAVQEIPVGVSLRVEPSVQGGGKIGLRIRAKSSTLGPPLPPDDIPEEFSRVVEAEVVVADGETAVLGGLRREARSRSGTGVPVLRALPLVGILFGKRASDRDREELIVLVTPHLLD